MNDDATSTSERTDPDISVLDNVAWHALTGPHQPFAEGTHSALRYRRDVSVFHAMADDDAGTWAELSGLVGPDGTATVFRALPITPPPEWEALFVGDGLQMVGPAEMALRPDPPTVDVDTGRAVTLRLLDDADVPAMIALVELTEPGPFRVRTIELGGYVGIFHDDELVAMAGRRMRPPGFCEVSAVCTHPTARRRGYASVLTAHVADGIAASGATPFLHLASGNLAALAAYQQLGFRTRTRVSFGAYRYRG